MSRAMNVDADEATVIAMCAKHDAAISAIEKLPKGGTRVVLMNGDDAAVIRHAFRTKQLAADAPRTVWLRHK